MNTRLLIAVVVGSAILTAVAPALAAPVGSITFVEGLPIDEDDRSVLEAFIAHAVEYAEKLNEPKIRQQCAESPEMFAWVEFRYLNALNIAYELTADTRYLDLLRDRFALFRKIMTTETDPYLGWYGKALKARQPKDDPERRIDELQMNFRAIGLLARWIELARTDPAYAAANAETIQAYLDLMTHHLYPKWDARGHFAEIPGRGGVYHGLDFPLEIKVTLSFEKLSIMVDGLLKLHRVTGDPVYLKRALQLGAWFKSNLVLKDGHYEWMSWVPAGRWDVHPTKPDAWRTGWIAPDPNAPWYVAALSIALNLYQHGLLFDDTDLARFVTTQKTMCWNGDMDHPAYRTVAGTTGKWVKGRFLSHQLAHYDSTLRTLAFDGPHEPEVRANAAKSWQCCVGGQSYVRQKFIEAPRVAADPRPHRRVGATFLADPANRAFYDGVCFQVTNTEDTTPRKPSEMIGEN